ncbi:unnamed protein product [Musa acuminata var. zebrina]
MILKTMGFPAAALSDAEAAEARQNEVSLVKNRGGFLPLDLSDRGVIGTVFPIFLETRRSNPADKPNSNGSRRRFNARGGSTIFREGGRQHCVGRWSRFVELQQWRNTCCCDYCL